MVNSPPLSPSAAGGEHSDSSSLLIGLPLDQSYSEESPSTTFSHHAEDDTLVAVPQQHVPDAGAGSSPSSSFLRREQQPRTTGTPSIVVPPEDEADRNSSDSQTENRQQLEERVRQLESKLATISMLLATQQQQQQQQLQSSNYQSPTKQPSSVQGQRQRHSTPPMIQSRKKSASSSEQPLEEPPPATPKTTSQLKSLYAAPAADGRDNLRRRSSASSTVPYLESPALSQTKRRLSSNVHVVGGEAKNSEQEAALSAAPTANGPQRQGQERAPPPPPEELLSPDLSPRNIDEDDTTVENNSSPRRPHKRNLSYNLLYASEEEEEAVKSQEGATTSAAGRENDDNTITATNSLTIAERRWLRPMVLQFQREHAARTEDSIRNKWLNYLNSVHETSMSPDVEDQMQEFIRVPFALEACQSFGFLICVDSFLYMITILPIRFVWSVFLLLLLPRRPAPPYQFHRRHTYQLIQVTILYTIYRFVLLQVSIGKLYHWIRGQSMIKLYVLIAIVEVFDRLFGSLGQDCLDSLYWNTVNRPRSTRMVVSSAVVWVYATLHTLLLLVHVATLNVAMNSADQALLTLLISGNFAEIKSTVFKKYNKNALFKITASDICERFKLALFLSLVLLLNVCQGMTTSTLGDYWRICMYVAGAELLSDWIKHAFITKFNFLSASVYPEYTLLLAGDVTGIGHEGVNLDHSHAVVKRIGFAQMPLVCLLFRLLRESIKYATRRQQQQGVPARMLQLWQQWQAAAPVLWLLLLATKVALGRMLLRMSLAKLHAAPEVVVSTKKKNQ